MMPTTCEFCLHWHAHRSQVRALDAAVGECHAQPPARDFTWPKTKAINTCSAYAARVAFAQAAPFDPSRTAGPAAAVAQATPPSTAPQTADLALGLPARTPTTASTVAGAGLPGSRRTSRKPATP